MNWVGGSRNRLVMRNDGKKQREFFEKRKMQQKLKNIGISLPTPSPDDAGSGSVDLMTLFIVNQIAAKKGCKDPPKVAVLGSCKGGARHKRKEPLVLPMSPCSPSQLYFMEAQPDVQGSRKRKNGIPQRCECQQLSPVLESAFSDNSASDYLPVAPDAPSPFSSTSSASSGQGTFPLQLNLQKQSQTPHRPSPAPWETSVISQTKPFHPFSQPRSMTNTSPWSYKANQPFFHVETPTASQVLFGSPEPGKTETGDRVRHEDTSLHQPEDKESTLDFVLNQSETEQQSEEYVFGGFNNEEYGRCSHSGSSKSKIHLTDQTSVKLSTPQTVPDSDYMEGELSSNTDTSFSCLGHNKGPVNGSEYSPSYSCRGYLSSDSDDDEDCCQPCLPVSASYTDPAFSADTLNGSQGNLKKKFSELMPHTPQIRPQTDFSNYLKVPENMATPHKACGSKGLEKKSSTPLLLFSHPPTQTQSSDVCKCKNTSSETRDAGTQTIYTPSAEACDASTQCSFVADSALGFGLHLPNADMSEQPPATGRQADTASESDALTASTETSRSEDKQKPWSKKKSKEDSMSGRSMIPANNCAKVILQKPTNCFLNAQSTGQENEEGRDETEHHENCPPMRNFSDQGRGEGASATRANILPEETEMLQEVADILLLLKQRKIPG